MLVLKEEISFLLGRKTARKGVSYCLFKLIRIKWNSNDFFGQKMRVK